MAHFYTSIRGNKGELHRLGHKTTGAQCGVRGWDDGVEVHATYNQALERNEYVITCNAGSNGGRTRQEIGTFFISNTFPVFKLTKSNTEIRL